MRNLAFIFYAGVAFGCAAGAGQPADPDAVPPSHDTGPESPVVDASVVAPVAPVLLDDLARCVEDAECRSGSCDGRNRCARPAGAPCAGAPPETCADDLWCAFVGPVGGAVCAPVADAIFCETDGDCPDAHCEQAAGATEESRGRCVAPLAPAPCMGHGECGPGNACRPGLAGRSCQPAGEAHEICDPSLPAERSCAAGLTCDRDTHTCLVVPRGACQLGGDCAEGNACVLGTCLHVPGEMPGDPCELDVHCGEGLVCEGNMCQAAHRACAQPIDCSPGSTCLDGICQSCSGPLCPCDGAVPESCPEGWVCSADADGLGACRRPPGGQCIEDSQCSEENVCVQGVCSAPRSIGETCGRLLPPEAEDAPPGFEPVDQHCAGERVLCHSVFRTCVPANGGQVWTPARRQEECAPELAHDSTLNECVIPGAALHAVVSRRIEAVSHGNSFGDWVCVDLSELMAEMGPLPPGYLLQVIEHAWSQEAYGEDVPGSEVDRATLAEPGDHTDDDLLDPEATRVCTRVRGQADGFLGLFGKGKKNRQFLTVSLVAYNPSKVQFHPKDCRWPMMDGGNCPSELFRNDESDGYRLLAVPPRFDALAIQTIQTFIQRDDDNGFLLAEAGVNALSEEEQPGNLDLVNVDVERLMLFQANNQLSGGHCNDATLTSRQMILAWRTGLTPVVERARIRSRAGGGTLSLPFGVPGVPGLGLALTKGLILRNDILGPALFAACGATLTSAAGSPLHGDLCPPLEDGHATIPFQNEIVGTVSHSAEFFCDKATAGLGKWMSVFADACGPAGDLLGGLVNSLINSIIDAHDGCGGSAADDDACVRVRIECDGFACRLEHDVLDGNGNSAGAVDLLMFQIQEDQEYFPDAPQGAAPAPGLDPNVPCIGEGECAADHVCAPLPTNPGVTRCLPGHGVECIAYCGAPGDVCRVEDGDLEDPAVRCLVPQREGGVCTGDEACAPGLVCAEAELRCRVPLGAPCGEAVDPAEALPCPALAVCLEGACRMTDGGPCTSSTDCVSGSCDLRVPWAPPDLPEERSEDHTDLYTCAPSEEPGLEGEE